MKKLMIIPFICCLCTYLISAQTVPDGRQLFGAIHQYCQEHYGYLESADVSVNGKGEETYILKEVGRNWKNWVGSERHGEYYYYITRWDYATIKKDANGKIKAILSKKVKSAEANSNYKRTGNWRYYTENNITGNNPWINAFTKQLNTYLAEPDIKYDQYINAALTDVQFLYGLSKTKNALWVKAFFKRNNVIGRTAKLEVTVASLEESDDDDYLYKLTGTVGTANQSTGEVAIPVTCYSNDDAMLDANVGKKVNITGKIADIEKNDNDGTVSAFKIID